MIKVGWAIFMSVLVGFLVWLYMEYVYSPSQTITIKSRKDYDILTFRLPNSHDPDVFGRPYWSARHFLAKMTPCPACRNEAMSHEKAFQDYVNIKKGKSFFDEKNFNEWAKKFDKYKTSNS